MTRAFNISARKNGGLRFVKVGRFFFAFCVCKEYRPLMPAVAKACAAYLSGDLDLYSRHIWIADDLRRRAA